MGIPGSANLLLLGGSAQAYQIEQSLRFNSTDSANLSRTPSSTGNRKTFTVSCWVKRAQIGATQMIWSAGPASGGNIYLYFTSTDELQLSVDTEASGIVKTTQKFRDASAWYHIVCAVDTSQATAANRVKFFINGDAVSSFASASYPSQNHDTHWNHTSGHRIGQRNDGTAFYINAYIAEFYNLDGTAVSDAQDFAEADDNGVWRPIQTSGLTYGTNGFYLDFSNSSSLGEDQAGSNDWTANNFTTSGTGTDVMSDTPTTNWCTLNPLAVRPSYVPTFSDGNLKVTHRSGTGQYSHCGSTFAFKSDDSSGFYCEVQNGAESSGGVSLIVTDYGVHNLHPDVSNGFSTNTNGGIGYDSNGYIRNFGTTIDYTGSASYNSGSDILGIAVKDNKVWFSINGTWIASGNPSTGANPVITLSSTQTFVVGSYGQGSRTFIKNFGQRAFAYTVPTGFKAMNTANLPAPDIADGSEYFNTLLYTGDGTAPRSLTGVGFQPDWVWIKARNSAWWHVLGDSVRGSSGTNGLNLNTNSTAFEGDENSGHVESWDSDGFTVEQADSGANPLVNVNNNGSPYVAWNWKAGGTASSNTAGTITSTVSANPSAGFSIVSYTGTGNAATVGHGLGVAPSLIIEKNRDLSQNWAVYHSALGATKALILDDNFSEQTATYYWNDTAPTSTVFSIGTWNGVNSNTQKHIAYCFAEVEGYSKFGSYTGNGSSDGPFVFCGFKPAFLLIKSSSNSGEAWILEDSARDTYNPATRWLYPNLSSAESTGLTIDFLSNGFKLRISGTSVNTSSATYVFLAFSENPFGGDGVSPATAR